VMYMCARTADFLENCRICDTIQSLSMCLKSMVLWDGGPICRRVLLLRVSPIQMPPICRICGIRLPN